MKVIIFESLQLRLSLIGGMFDTIVVSAHNYFNELNKSHIILLFLA